MKSIMRIIALSIIMVFAFNLNYTQAKERKHHRKHHQGMHKLTDKQKEQLLEIKKYLDSELSEEDLDKLNELRSLVKDERTSVMHKLKEMKESGAEKSEIKDYMKSLKEEKREKKEVVKEALKEIVENNTALMKEIGEKLKEFKPGKAEFKGKGKQKNHDKKKHFARFLLWDGTFPEKPEFEGKELLNESKLEVTSSESTLTVETEESVSGTAYIYDTQGSQVSEIGLVNLNEGENNIPLNSISSKLNNGAYFLIIESENGTKRGKFIFLK